jgi:hypothetical protein
MSSISMPLVGTAIIGGRETVPDMPSTLPAPTATVTTSGPISATLDAGTYCCIVTQRNPWGETIGATEVTGIIVSAGQGILVTSALLPGATTIRAYLTLPGGAAGTEIQFAEGITSPFTISEPLTQAGIPPTRNTAWLPDTDGGFISAGAIFRWLNQGLALIARESGGFLDYCGVQSVINQPLYQIPGQWNEITSIWYDGYWMAGGDRGQFFRRNNVTSQVLSSATISVASNRMILEVYPQPARTASVTTLSGSMTSQSTTNTVASSTGFLLPFGFMQVDQEIMAYGGISGNTFTGLIRGLGGSAAVAHPNNAPVTELNLFWSGKRQTVQFGGFAPGSSLSVLPVPSGWEYLLTNYIAGRAKILEHDNQGIQLFTQEMRAEIKSWALTTKTVATRRQIGGTGSPVVYYPTPAGGLIVP